MKTQLETLSSLVEQFCDERDWAQFHTNKDLAMGLSIEASELLQIFLWKNKDEIKALFESTSKREHIEDELADIFYFLLRIAQLNEIDLQKALENKILKNGIKYPVEKSKGSAKKYNEL